MKRLDNFINSHDDYDFLYLGQLRLLSSTISAVMTAIFHSDGQIGSIIHEVTLQCKVTSLILD